MLFVKGALMTQIERFVEPLQKKQGILINLSEVEGRLMPPFSSFGF